MREIRIKACAKLGSALTAARKSCSVSGMRYSSHSLIAFSKLVRASAEEVVIGSLADAFFGLVWTAPDSADAAPSRTAKDVSTSRQRHQRRSICPPESVDFLLLIRRAYHAVSAPESYLGYRPTGRFFEQFRRHPDRSKLLSRHAPGFPLDS